MAAERQANQEGTDDRNLQSPLQDPNLRNVLFPLRMPGLQSYLEPLVQRVVREEVSAIFRRHPCQRTTLNQTERYGASAFQLCFMNRLPPTIFTFSKLTAENGAQIQIALCEATSPYPIVTNAPQSSMKIEICPLEGDFDCNDWTADEFNANIVRERKNKGALLNGDRSVILKNGIGSIPKIEFTDNSSWIRSGKFRIGAKIVDSAAAIEIREARSDPFRVKDCRGEAYKKHDCPSLNDPIWRLNKVAKNGKSYRQLSSHGIKTVKDLLLLHRTNQASLEQIFGNIPTKSREAIIEHAKACRELNDMRCVYPTGGQPGVLEREHASLSTDFMALDQPSPDNSVNSLATSQQVQAAAQSSNPDQDMWWVLSQPSTSASRIGEAVNNNQGRADQQLDWIRMLLYSPKDEDFLSGLHMDGNDEGPLAGSQTLLSSGSGYGAEFMDHSSLPRFCGHTSSSKENRKKVVA